MLALSAAIIGTLSLAGCGGASGGTDAAIPTPTPTPTATPTPSPTPTPTPTPTVAPTDIVVAIAPASVTVSVGDTRVFTASVSGDAGVSQSVVWSVQEGSGGGTISAEGLYAAPAIPGTYHIIATSQADSSRATTATVIVQAGNAAGSIQ